MSFKTVLIKSIHLLVLAALFSISACSDNNSDKVAKKAVEKVAVVSKVEASAESIEEKWGVRDFKIRQTSAGYMLDVRYWVSDAEKAKPLFIRKLRPFIIEEASGETYGVPASPKVGFLRQAPSYLKENKEYFLFIANPGQRVKKGAQLTLVIGDFRVEHITVE